MKITIHIQGTPTIKAVAEGAEFIEEWFQAEPRLCKGALLIEPSDNMPVIKVAKACAKTEKLLGVKIRHEAEGLVGRPAAKNTERHSSVSQFPSQHGRLITW